MTEPAVQPLPGLPADTPRVQVTVADDFDFTTARDAVVEAFPDVLAVSWMATDNGPVFLVEGTDATEAQVRALLGLEA